MQFGEQDQRYIHPASHLIPGIHSHGIHPLHAHRDRDYRRNHNANPYDNCHTYGYGFPDANCYPGGLLQP